MYVGGRPKNENGDPSLLLSKRQELSSGKNLVDSIPTAGELRGDLVDMAAGTGAEVASKGQQVKIPSEAKLDFTLKAPLTVTLSH
jgi:hypothetical protein